MIDTIFNFLIFFIHLIKRCKRQTMPQSMKNLKCGCAMYTKIYHALSIESGADTERLCFRF